MVSRIRKCRYIQCILCKLLLKTNKEKRKHHDYIHFFTLLNKRWPPTSRFQQWSLFKAWLLEAVGNYSKHIRSHLIKSRYKLISIQKKTFIYRILEHILRITCSIFLHFLPVFKVELYTLNYHIII